MTIMTYWYTTKVCNTFNAGPGGSICNRYPRTRQISMLEEFALCVLREILRTKVCNTDIKIAPTLKLGGAGADRRHKAGSCQVHLFLQVSLSAVLQTFVCHLYPKPWPYKISFCSLGCSRSGRLAGQNVKGVTTPNPGPIR